MVPQNYMNRCFAKVPDVPHLPHCPYHEVAAIYFHHDESPNPIVGTFPCFSLTPKFSSGKHLPFLPAKRTFHIRENSGFICSATSDLFVQTSMHRNQGSDENTARPSNLSTFQLFRPFSPMIMSSLIMRSVSFDNNAHSLNPIFPLKTQYFLDTQKSSEKKYLTLTL